MFHISHNEYNSDNEEQNNDEQNNEEQNNDEQNNEEQYSTETIARYINERVQDLQDIDLLQIQWKAQLILVLGYLLEYTASIQGIEILKARIAKRDEAFQAGEYDWNNEADLQDEVEEAFKNIGINADATVLLAAQLELFGQTFLTNIAWTKYQRLFQNIDTQDFLLTKTATREIFIGAVFEEIAYIFNLMGANILFQLNNSDNPQNDDNPGDIDDE